MEYSAESEEYFLKAFAPYDSSNFSWLTLSVLVQVAFENNRNEQTVL